MARGNGRQKIVRDDRDYQRLLDGLEAIVDKFGFEILSFVCMPNQSRDIAAWLARRLTVATLRELVEPFGLGHPDSVRSLLGRAEAAMQQSVKLRREVEHLRDRIRDGTQFPINQKKHEKRV